MTNPRAKKLITEVVFTQAGPDEIRQGLVGFVTCVVADSFRLAGITLRMTAERRPSLSFPKRTDRYGLKHASVSPLDNRVRRAVEAEIFEALGIDPEGDCDVR